MKHLLAAAAALSLLGCSLFGSDRDLPDVWVIPELVIRVEWNEPDTLPNAAMIRLVLTRMNAAIVDASDGQIRVARFRVVRGSSIPEKTPGVGTLQAADVVGQGFGTFGTPASPGAYKFFLPGVGQRSYENAGSEAAHEFFHSWVGLRDEYKRRDGKAAECLDNPVLRVAADACLMYSYRYSELCRDGNHNSSTEQGDVHGRSCYDHLREVLAAYGKVGVRIPSDHVTGPEAAEPVIEIFK